jgi:lysophospholipase L1-like esterase
LFCAAALVAAGCTSASGEQVNRRVAVVGDSITYLSASDITEDLEGMGYDPSVVGKIGYTAAQVAPNVTAARGQDPAIVLFELGTNDVTRSDRGQGSAADFERWMNSYIAQFPHSCLIATTVSSHRPSLTMDRTADEINAWLHQKFALVVDWNSYEWSQRQKDIAIVEPDEVHPNEVGQAALAQLDLAAVQACHR